MFATVIRDLGREKKWGEAKDFGRKMNHVTKKFRRGAQNPSSFCIRMKNLAASSQGMVLISWESEQDI